MQQRNCVDAFWAKAHLLRDPTRKICSNVGSSRLTCFSLERRRRRRDGKKGRDGGQAGQAVATMSEFMKKLRCLEDKVKLQQTDIDTLYGMCQTAHKRITLQDNRITELETTNVAVQEVAVQKTTTVEVMEPPKKRQRKDEDGQGNHLGWSFLTDMQGNTVAHMTIWNHAKILPSLTLWRTVARGTSLGNIALRTGPSMASGTKPRWRPSRS